MILGIDTGTATLGWAEYDPAKRQLVDLGAILNEKSHRDITLDYVQRSAANANVLASKVARCSMLVVEKLSLGMPGSIAKLCVGLAWGVIIGQRSMITPAPPIRTIAPQRWQREFLPDAGSAVDYDELAQIITAHIRARHPLAAIALERIPERHRNHAIDAAGIALCGGYRAERCDRVDATRPILLGAACPHGNGPASSCSMCRGSTPKIVTTANGVARVNGKATRATDPGVSAKYLEHMKNGARKSHLRSRERAR